MYITQKQPGGRAASGKGPRKGMPLSLNTHQLRRSLKFGGFWRLHDIGMID